MPVPPGCSHHFDWERCFELSGPHTLSGAVWDIKVRFPRTQQVGLSPGRCRQFVGGKLPLSHSTANRLIEPSGAGLRY